MVEDEEDEVFVEPKIGIGGVDMSREAVADGLREGCRALGEACDVGMVTVGAGVAVPVAVVRDKIGAQGGAFVVDAVGEEGVAVCDAGDAGGEGALGGSEQCGVQGMLWSCTGFVAWSRLGLRGG